MLSYIIYSEFLKNCHVLEEVIEKFWNQSKTVRLLSSRKEWCLPLRLRNTTGPKTVLCGTLDVNCERLEKFVMTDNRLRAVRKEIYLASLSNENVEIPDVMNSNRKFYVSLVGTPLSHTTNSECLCFNSPCIIYESEHWEWSTSSFHFWRPGRQRSRCSRSSFEPITQGTTATRANCNLLQRHAWGTLLKVLLKSNWRFILNSLPYRNSSKTTVLLRIVLR